MSELAIVDFDPDNLAIAAQMAQILVEAFRERAPHAWPDRAAADEEVSAFGNPAVICRVAINPAGKALGWVGGLPEYDGRVWELHPLAVHPAVQKSGIGRRLVADFEEQVRARGGLTVMLGTDDEMGETSLSDVDLYTDLWDKIKHIQNRKGHPFEFYQKCGYRIVGVMPDANGRGKPDIYMAKRIG